MRIVSLLPSATEIVCALGLEDQLVGVTHECDYPGAALTKPRVTSTALPPAATSSAAIDAGINQLLAEGRSIYHLDLDLLERLQPDLILTQELCDVCAVAYSEVNRAAASVSSNPRVVSLEPNTLSEVLASIRQVGELTDCVQRAEAYVQSLERRLAVVRSAVAGIEERPKVYCMEWIDPPMRAGHWVPEMVEMAGGAEGFGRKGEPSTKTDWAEVLAYAPEVVVLMPCGFDLVRTLEEAAVAQGFPGWADLPAVKAGNVWAVNGSAYFSRPGPRLVDGVEILATILHPDRFQGALPPESLARFRA